MIRRYPNRGDIYGKVTEWLLVEFSDSGKVVRTLAGDHETTASAWNEWQKVSPADTKTAEVPEITG